MSRKPVIKTTHARQAIVTKYHGVTNTRPSRIGAKAEAGSASVSYDHGISSGVVQHSRAAVALAEKMGWTAPFYGQMVGGALPNNAGYAFVEMPPAVAKLHEALGNLVQFCVGNRGSREGNPYCKPEVKAALDALFYAANERDPHTSTESLDSADAWRIEDDSI